MIAQRTEVPPMAHLALYARCSTADQDLASQLRQLHDYASRRGAEALEFKDHGVSGAKAARPGLDALLATVRRREVEAVVCTRLDRLGRSAAHLAALADELKALGVALVVLDLGLDTATPQGALVLGVLARPPEVTLRIGALARRTIGRWAPCLFHLRTHCLARWITGATRESIHPRLRQIRLSTCSENRR
jgi:hypothetical protein